MASARSDPQAKGCSSWRDPALTDVLLNCAKHSTVAHTGEQISACHRRSRRARRERMSWTLLARRKRLGKAPRAEARALCGDNKAGARRACRMFTADRASSAGVLCRAGHTKRQCPRAPTSKDATVAPETRQVIANILARRERRGLNVWRPTKPGGGTGAQASRRLPMGTTPRLRRHLGWAWPVHGS